jgi:hypothetical protein
MARASCAKPDEGRDRVNRKVPRLIVTLVGLIGLLAGIASAAGVFLRGTLATVTFTTVRGDPVETLVDGVYRYNGEAIAAEGIGWDAVTLVLVVPSLLALLLPLRGGSVRAALAVTGILTYLLYQYFEYAVFLAYGPMYPVYVGIVGLSVTGIALLLSRLELRSLATSVSGRFPRRAMVGFGLFMAVMLGGLWLPLIARTMFAQHVPELAGGSTFVVQAFDLGLLVPLGLGTAVTVFRRLPVGYVLSAIVVVKGMAMGVGIAAMLVVESMATGVTQLAPIVSFAAIALVSAVLAIRVYGSIGDIDPTAAASDRPPTLEGRVAGVSGSGRG